jgi:hypothetical protein
MRRSGRAAGSTHEETTMVNDLIAQFRYCTWRMELWGLGYGTYDDIDRDVSRGKLVPGVIPEEWRARNKPSLPPEAPRP